MSRSVSRAQPVTTPRHPTRLRPSRSVDRRDMGDQENRIGTLNATNAAIGERSHAGDRYVGPPRSGSRVKPGADDDGDRSRRVFVIHGRDEDARRAVFEFLRALELVPMEWEHLVRATGTGTPSLAQVVAN